MTKTDYKKLNKIIGKLEDQAIKETVDIMSADFKALIKEVIENNGFTMEEYDEFDNKEDKFELEGASKIKGDKGDVPKKEELLSIIKPLIPVVKDGEDGHTPTKDELVSLIKPLIPKVKDGKDGNSIKGDKGDTVIGPPGEPGNDGKTIVKIDNSFKKELKKLKDEMIKYVNRMTTPAGGRSDGKGGRFYEQVNQGNAGGPFMPHSVWDKASGKTAIGDDRNKYNVLKIDLSSQCNGVLTVFALGRSVEDVILLNNNGGIATHTLNTAKDTITMEYAPGTGEELTAITLIK